MTSTWQQLDISSLPPSLNQKLVHLWKKIRQWRDAKVGNFTMQLKVCSSCLPWLYSQSELSQLSSFPPGKTISRHSLVRMPVGLPNWSLPCHQQCTLENGKIGRHYFAQTTKVFWEFFFHQIDQENLMCCTPPLSLMRNFWPSLLNSQLKSVIWEFPMTARCTLNYFVWEIISKSTLIQKNTKRRNSIMSISNSQCNSTVKQRSQRPLAAPGPSIAKRNLL